MNLKKIIFLFLILISSCVYSQTITLSCIDVVSQNSENTYIVDLKNQTIYNFYTKEIYPAKITEYEIIYQYPLQQSSSQQSSVITINRLTGLLKTLSSNTNVLAVDYKCEVISNRKF